MNQRRLKTKPNGYIIHETASVVSIATGFRVPSKNPKTGPMVHVWILPRNLNPLAAKDSGQDRLVCGDCSLRRNLGGSCYVNLYQAPYMVWKAYKRGVYPKAGDLRALFSGRAVRFGAYGDPIFLPLSKVEVICSVAAGWTGFTHQWRNYFFQSYRQFFMASCDEKDYLEAQEAGWRTFTISKKPLPAQMLCPASKEFINARGFKVQCVRCRRCGGTKIPGRSVQIAPHGNLGGSF